MTKKYILTWESFSDHLQTVFAELYQDADYSDIILVSDDEKEFKANRFVLYACSPVLKNLSDTNLSHYKLEGIQGQELESILEFMYLGNANVCQERMEEFIKAAKDLQIKEIFDTLDLEYREDFGGDEELEDISISENSENKDPEDMIVESGADTEDISKRAKSTGRNSAIKPKKKCPLCWKVFNSPQALFIHNKVKHEGVMYPCDQCDRQYQKKSTLKIHVETKHEGIKYPCNYCGKLYTNLKNHVLFLHSNVKYNCTECNFESTNKRRFRFHMESKHEGVRHYCTQCDYQANHRNSLNVHIQSKHEGINYECQECGHKSSTEFNAQRHVDRTHLGIRYPCDLCGKEYRDIGTLRNHMKSKH